MLWCVCECNKTKSYDVCVGVTWWSAVPLTGRCRTAWRPWCRLAAAIFHQISPWTCSALSATSTATKSHSSSSAGVAVTLFLFRSCHPSLLSFSTTSHTHTPSWEKAVYGSLAHMQFLRQDRLIYMLCSQP